MIITKIELKNVVGIYNGGEGLEKIKINFDNDYSKIILILGKNGSGKSTLVNSLDPFAVETIREGKEGYKKITYKNKKVKYVIEHIYKPTKTGHTVKSYITKIDKNNDKYDLNPNGNSTSFNEIVELEFGVSKTSMKLIKMGTELSSMVTMTPAERKKFINVFTEETGIYNKYYKKINDDFRTIKKILQNTESKITNIGNIDSIKAEFKICSDSIINIEKTITNNNNTKAILKNDINKLESKYIDFNIDYNKFKECSNNGILSEYIKLDYNKVYSDMITMKSQKELLKNEKDNILKNITSNSLDIHNIEDEINKLNEMLSDTEDIDINDLKEQKELLQEKIDIYSSWFNSLPSNFKEIDSDYVNKMIISLDEYREQFLSIFNDKNIDVTLLSKFDMDIDYTSEMSSIHARKNILSQDIIKIENDIAILKNDITKDSNLLNKKPKNCTNSSCPLLQGVSSDIIDNKINTMEEKVNDKKEMYKERDYLENMLLSLALCKQIKDIILRMMCNISDNDNYEDILKTCIKSIRIYNSNILNKHINEYKKLAESLSLYKEIKGSVDMLNEITLQINKSEFSKSMLERRKSISLELNNISKRNKELMDKYKDIDTQLNKVNKSLNEITEIYSYKDDVIEYKNNIEIIEDIKNNNIIIEKLNSELDKINNTLKENISIKDSLLEQKDKLLYKKKYYNELSRYRKVILDNYGKLEMLHDALSINEGIPLIFIKTLLKQIRSNANKLLKSAFGDKLKLKKFVIDEKEFSMPLAGKGDGTKDVRFASSGERSIIGLSISLALSQYVNSKYNIITLDESDGPLDFNLRRSFLEILEYQCKVMNIKQVFNISHNGTFDDYRTNVILFKGADCINMKEKNILYKFE